jgi:sugar O-acyltransferase (sialic acid O-acetyltransferase NeuD family)
MKKKISIYGAGGLGREVLALIRALPEWEVMGFYDDGITKGSVIKDVKVLGGLHDLLQISSALHVVIAIGDPRIKAAIATKLSANANIMYPVIVHPDVLVMDKSSVNIGEGSIITAGVKITCDIQLGKHVLINLNSTLGHDVQIGDCSSIMPGVNISGEVKMANEVLIGSGANILNGVHVEDGARVGSGAVVTKHVKAGATVVGVPAREV